jgi:hypothetical protein
MRTILNGSESATMKIWKYDMLKGDLARALIRENKPDEAIELLMEIIKKNRQPDSFMGERVKMSSAHYGMESIYYRDLADAYTLKKDKDSAGKAHKKSLAAEKESARLKPIEDRKEAAQKKKEKDALLN